MNVLGLIKTCHMDFGQNYMAVVMKLHLQKRLVKQEMYVKENF